MIILHRPTLCHGKQPRRSEDRVTRVDPMPRSRKERSRRPTPERVRSTRLLGEQGWRGTATYTGRQKPDSQWRRSTRQSRTAGQPRRPLWRVVAQVPSLRSEPTVHCPQLRPWDSHSFRLNVSADEQTLIDVHASRRDVRSARSAGWPGRCPRLTLQCSR